MEKYFEEHFDEILESMSEIMSIDSSFSQPEEGKPFGKGSASALEWAENFGRKIGMRVRNIDNYAVVLDWDEREPVLGILSHLDVVPAGEGWTYEPFACTLKDGVIYGRGAIDDKGPTVAVLYALKYLKERGARLKGGLRMIIGGNEEGGCEDLAYYEKKEKFPPAVITPDGSFPVLNCEKGMLHLEFSGEGSLDCDGMKFTSVKGGTVINAIPGKTVCKGEFSGLIPTFADCRVEAEQSACDSFTILGQSSHGSRPENGINTVTAFLSALAEKGSNLATTLSAMFPHGEYNGKSVGMGFSDSVSGEMTCALTLFDYENGKFTAGVDIRYPIDRTLREIKGIICGELEKAGMKTENAEGMEPHYVPEDSPTVQALLRAYEKVRGEKGYCIAEGGITYVHNTPGGVAFGAEYPDENNNMHGADEHITVSTLRDNFLMYVEAITQCTMHNAQCTIVGEENSMD